jgi:hypothetical protein
VLNLNFFKWYSYKIETSTWLRKDKEDDEWVHKDKVSVRGVIRGSDGNV